MSIPSEVDLEHLAHRIEDVAQEAAIELKNLDNANIATQIEKFHRLQTAYKVLDEARKSVYHLLNDWDKTVLPARFEQEDIDRVRIPSLGRSFGPVTKYGTKYTDKEKAYGWLSQHAPEMIKTTVNAQALAAFTRERAEEGEETPGVELTSFQYISSSKYTPKNGE